VYKKDYDTLTKMALNSAIADAIIAAHPKKKKIVYAPACYLDREYMEDNLIEFVGLPYNLFRRGE
jgi:adenine-specific DNA-methyltransferase